MLQTESMPPREPTSPTTGTLTLSPEDEASPWAGELRAMLERARDEAGRRLGLAPPARIRVTTFAREHEFQNYLGYKPTHVVAVARPDRNEIVILRSAWLAEGEGGRQQTLTHEMAHLIIGHQVDGELPTWLNEGLAMLAARQLAWQYNVRLAFSGALGGLLPLAQLENNVLLGGEAQSLAYAQSLALTRFLIRRDYPMEGEQGNNPAPLLRDLTHPRRGPALLERMWDPSWRQALEWQWRESYKSFWNWMAALSGTGLMWLVMSLLFLLAYWRKRRFARQKRELFAADEARDEELGLEIPPWEYEAEPDDDDERRL